MSDLLQRMAINGNVLDTVNSLSTNIDALLKQFITYHAGDGRYMRRVEPGGLIPVLNAKTLFGATGDGSTDDAFAIQSALEAADNAGGAVVLLPASASEYILGTGLDLRNLSNVWLVGQGPGLTKIKAKSGSTISQLALLENCSNIAFANLEMDGDTANTTTNRHCIRVWQNSQDVRIENCYLHHGSGPEGDALYLNDNDANQGTFVDNIRRVWVRGSRLSGCSRNGMSIVSARDIFISDLQSDSNDLYGLDIEPNNSSEVVRRVKINGYEALSNEEYGLLIYNNVSATLTDIQVVNFHIEDSNSVGSMRVKGASLHAQFTNGQVVGGPLDGIAIDDGTSFIKFEQVSSRSHVQSGFAFASGGNTRFVEMRGCSAISNGYHGAILNGVVDAEISGGVYLNNSTASGGTRGGITLLGATGVRVIGVRATDTQGTKTQRHGIRYQSSADFLIIVGNDCRGNATASIDNDASHTTVQVANNLT